MKIVFNYQRIQGTVFPSIDDAVSDIDSAISISNNISVPNDFMFAIYLRNLNPLLTQHRRTLVNLKTYLERTNSMLNSSDANTEVAINRIKDINIPKRMTAISKM